MTSCREPSPTSTEAARLVVASARAGDRGRAVDDLRRAQAASGPSTRRDRQLLQLAELFIDGDAERAAGLALEHVAAFPSDADVLTGPCPDVI